MLTNVYSIRDQKTQMFLNPYTAINDADACRILNDVMDQRGSKIGKYPEDFILFQLGTFDDNTGKMEALIAPNQVIACYDLVKVGKEREENE